MINIITNAELNVTEKQKALVKEALGPDGIYIRMKENLIDMLDRGEIKSEDRAKIIAETISQMSSSIISSAMSVGLQWAAQEKEAAFKREEMSRTLELLEKQVLKATEDAVGSIAQKQMLQAQMIRDYGSPILDNEGNVVALSN